MKEADLNNTWKQQVQQQLLLGMYFTHSGKFQWKYMHVLTEFVKLNLTLLITCLLLLNSS